MRAASGWEIQRPIGRRRAQLWLVEPAAVRGSVRLADYESWLADPERRRADAFHFEKHRHEFLVTRALERTALASYIGVSPSSLRFIRNELDRPQLFPRSKLRYSLTNTLELVGCLVSDCHEVGVDTEPLSRAPDILEVAGMVFAPEERSRLAELPSRDVPRRLVELWTLKESYIKAVGKGLQLPLDRFWFDIAPGRIALTLGPEIADQAERWAFSLVERNGQLVAACVGCGQSVPPVIDVLEPEL